MKEKRTQCEAKYGDGQCKELATTGVIANGVYFNLCKQCAKVAVKQIKLNHS